MPRKSLPRSPPLLRGKVPQVLTPVGQFKPRSNSTPDTMRDVNREPEVVEVSDFEFERPTTSPQQVLKRKREETRASRALDRSGPTSGVGPVVNTLASSIKLLTGLVKGQVSVKPEIGAAVANTVKIFNELQREVKTLSLRDRSLSRDGKVSQGGTLAHGSSQAMAWARFLRIRWNSD